MKERKAEALSNKSSTEANEVVPEKPEETLDASETVHAKVSF